MNKKILSLRTEALLLLLGSVGAGIACFFCFHFLGNVLVNSILKTSGYLEREEQKSADSFQNFVSGYGIAATDYEALDAWVEKEGVVYIAVFRDDSLLYDSEYAYEAGEALTDHGYYSEAHTYAITFSDGTANVYLIGFYSLRYETMITVISIVLACIASFFLIMVFLQRKINYIKRLENEVRVLETGGLDHPVTVKGRDEIASLATELNEMRITLSNNFEMVQKLSEANTNLVTELSHDLRTPLTSLLLYLEILQKGKFRDEPARQEYLLKASDKAEEVRAMSNDLFERFLVSGKKKTELDPPQEIRTIFEDVLSEMAFCLESQGFRVENPPEWPAGEAVVSMDYISRIFNNISSNILKYADRSEPVTIRCGVADGRLHLAIENTAAAGGRASEVESTKIGLANIRLMMQKMSGESRAEEEGKKFRIVLELPVRNGNETFTGTRSL